MPVYPHACVCVCVSICTKGFNWNYPVYNMGLCSASEPKVDNYKLTSCKAVYLRPGEFSPITPCPIAPVTYE